MKIRSIIKIPVLFLLSILFIQNVSSQALSGYVYERTTDGKQEALTGVNVYWAGTTKGTFTDENGKFRLSRSGNGNSRLVVSLLGYRRDTLAVPKEKLKLEIGMEAGDRQLSEVEIKGRQDNSYVSRMKTQATTVINIGELQRAACCNLAESFETNASVDVSYSDAVSGARQIQLLGLSGIYSQIMTENVPLIRGLATPYGLNYVPGPWMESIQVAKGTSSVVQGYESITGQINVEYKKPESSEKFYLNLYGNSNLRFEANANGSVKITDKLSTSLLVHADDFRHPFDRNGDGFMDMPKLMNVNVFNRWDFISPGKWVSRLGIKYLYEERNGGQMDFVKSAWNTDTTGITNDSKKYGIGVKTNRFETFWKNGVFFKGLAQSSLGLILSFINHEQDAFYGIDLYHGHEQNFNANLIYTAQFNGEKHKISAGGSYFIDAYSENFVQTRLAYRYQYLPDTVAPIYADKFTLVNDSVYTYVMDRSEWAAGGFMEYTFNLKDKFTLIAGVRGDYNNRWGFLFTPRLHMRVTLAKGLALRGSVGKGYRSPNLLAENSPMLISQRVLYFAPGLTNEEAWNFGLSLTWDFTLFSRKAELTIDGYRTSFVKQTVVDQDSLPTAVFFYNLNGQSYANVAQAQFSFQPVKQFTVLAAFRYNDVKVTEGNQLRQKALVNQYKALLTLSYSTRFDKWKFDLTGQLNGPSRIPDTKKMPAVLQLPEKSPVWFNLLAQVTKKFRNFEIYIGGENLLNVRQENPIVEYFKPYHTHFDASMAWGPVVGITGYAGIRLTIK
ncbi:MAG: TonB-dependent receptor [Bacteroidetes bacterium]|nr:TonB-dependent receptor [Bacteroidota bacterium]